MKKFYTIFAILALLLLALATHIYASSVIMDLEDNTINNNINQNTNNLNTNSDNLITSNTFAENNSNDIGSLSQNNITNNTVANNSTSSDSSTVQTSNPVVTTTSTNDNNFLTVENILSISIIVIGILLIFLSIAILIRCKN